MPGLDTHTTSHDLEPLHEGDPRWELALRIVGSPGFWRASRLREFLLFISDHAIRGETAELTEQHIGIEVFKRPTHYSTTEDNVVRAQARQIRVKLSEYFGGPGKGEPLLLEIPKGSYVPIFSVKPDAPLHPAPLGPEQISSGTLKRKSLSAAVIAVLSALSLAAFLGLLWEARTVRSEAAAKESGSLFLPPLSWLFDGKQPVTIVVADTGFGLYQDLIGQAATLDDYLNPQFFANHPPHSKDKEIRSFSQRLSTRQFSSFADLALTQQILSLVTGRHEHVSVRFARDLHLRELASGNFLFIGSPYSNPWVSLFAKRRNFTTTLDAQSRQGKVLNGQPRPGEAKEFVMKGEDGLPGSTFGVVAFLPADAGSGNVLLLDGLNMEGTEAAGSFLTEGPATLSMMKKLGLKASSEKRYLEVVVETKAMAGTTRDSKIAAFRIEPAGK